MRVVRGAGGYRVYIGGLRIHHGLTGCALVLAGAATHDRLLVTVGLACIADDFRDFPWRLRDAIPRN